MRTRKTSKGLTINTIAGTPVVVLGMDLCDEKRKKCLGYAIQREDVTEGEKYWMSGMKTFEATDPLLGPGGQVSSHDHPFQSFQWSDYTAKSEHNFTHNVIHLYGGPWSDEAVIRAV